MVAWWGAVLGELHATFVDSKPGGGRALPLVALLVAQPLAPLVSSPGFCGGLFRPLLFVLLCVGFLLVAV